MGASREKDSADFDLEAFIDLFDEALTSDDPSVQKTLQHLMVIAALARNHDKHNSRNGPLRRMYEDLRDIHRRLERLETGNSSFGRPNTGWPGGGYNPHQHGTFGPVPNTGPGVYPYSSPGAVPIGGGGGGPTYPRPNTIWTTGTNAASVTPPNSGARSTTSYAYDPASSAMNAVAERVEDLLKSPKYKGSSVGTVDVKIS